jgi:menaquinone-dependent protoporphyrinogen oxidase
MTRVLVVYGSRHGATRGIAERIGKVLQNEGLEATVAAADRAPDISDVDAFVVGSGVYMGRWLKEPLQFLERNRATLATRPVWLFSSGPTPGSTAAKSDDPIENTFGPADGPGSGGRKQISELADATGARENHVFLGAYDPDDPPAFMAERLFRLLPVSKSVLPVGDFREWDAIEEWAREIAEALATPVG